jgi:hypothetical protein
MTSLVPDLLSLLRAHPFVRSTRVIEYDETPAGRVELKVRCQLPSGYQLQVWLHGEPDSQDYALQLFSDHPILRWDNAPHYPEVATAPHHFHDDSGKVGNSPLNGDALTDIVRVLMEIDIWMSQSQGRSL